MELKSLFQDFFKDFSNRLNTLEKGIEEDKPKVVAFAAHAIKGSSASLGALRIYKLALALEECARSRNLKQAKPWIHQIKREKRLLKKYLINKNLAAA